MVFASPIFLFLFLPLTLAAYFAFPRTWRNAVLLVASLAFYAWGEARYLPLIVGSVAFNWIMGRAIGGAADAKARRRRLVVAIAGNLAALMVFKYANFAVANVNALAPVLAPAVAFGPLAVTAIPLPLGISFFTFHAISYVVDVYKRNAQAEHNIPRFALYILLFPQLIAGPIIRWRDIAAQLGVRDQRVADFAYGVRRFVLGLGKKVLIANTLGRDRRRDLWPSGGRIDHAARLARPRVLHAADLFRFLRLLGHGHRSHAHVRISNSGKFQLPVHRTQRP